MSGNWGKGPESGPKGGSDADAVDVRIDDDFELEEISPPRKERLSAGRARSRWKPVLLWTGVLGLCLLGGTALFAPELTANLRGKLPARIVGNDGETGSGVVHVSLEQKSQARIAQNVVTPSGGPHVETVSGRDDDYLPKMHDQAVTEGTVITVPSGQGRLLRFDEPVESAFIADPAVADIRVVSSDLIYVYGKNLGLTNIIAVSARPTEEGRANGTQQEQVTASALLRVVADTRPPNEMRQQWAPSAPVALNFFGRRAAVTGHVANIDQAVDAANIAQTYSPKDQPPLNNTTLEGSNQINIRVRFAEAARNDLRSFGINWSVTSSNFSFSKVNVPLGTETGRGARIGGKIGAFDIEVLLDALQASGALSILAEPNLTAVTGETASFLAGGEVPIPVPTGNANNAITVQFKQFGVSLAFTPIMVKENRIALRVKPEVSSIAGVTDFGVQGFNLPSFTVRRAETTIEMASGQTFAMAGLFQRDITRNVDKMPILGDVPVLGQLFRSERYQRNETELVILITPYLVEPVSDKSLATPLDRAGDWQADIVGDHTAKGVPIETGRKAGFIMK